VETSDNATTTTHDLTTDLTTALGDFILAAVITNSGTGNYTSNAGGGYTSLPAGDVEYAAGVALAQWKVEDVAGTEDPVFTSSGNETTFMMAIGFEQAVAAVGGSKSLMLLGVGD
jgi:hypothetical protein